MSRPIDGWFVIIVEFNSVEGKLVTIPVREIAPLKAIVPFRAIRLRVFRSTRPHFVKSYDSFGKPRFSHFRITGYFSSTRVG
jgi:hypothetical protein